MKFAQSFVRKIYGARSNATVTHSHTHLIAQGKDYQNIQKGSHRTPFESFHQRSYGCTNVVVYSAACRIHDSHAWDIVSRADELNTEFTEDALSILEAIRHIRSRQFYNVHTYDGTARSNRQNDIFSVSPYIGIAVRIRNIGVVGAVIGVDYRAIYHNRVGCIASSAGNALVPCT